MSRAVFQGSVRPILLLEINEVPWRVVDFVLSSRGFPNVRRFFQRASTFTTVSDDVGELSPWVTWPSLHRGLNNGAHEIKHLGQDVASFRGSPVWEEYRKAGLSIGVCGSLQSWPPVDPGPGGFYVPDTFAHDERCIPARAERLQRFNLNQVRANGRVVQGGTRLGEGVALLQGAVAAAVRLRTFAALAEQMAFERIDPARTTRRPTFQTRLFWDLFLSLYDVKEPPPFATFFTNHVASAMHRFWRDLFPEDFADAKPRSATYRSTLLSSLHVLDSLLGDALKMQQANPNLLLVFATSMGQHAVHNRSHGFELVARDLRALVRAAGLPDEAVELRLAMAPQVSVAVRDDSMRDQLLVFLGSARAGEEKLFDVDIVDTSLSITLRTPGLAGVKLGAFVSNQKTFKFAEVGIEVVAVEAGTAYHVPEGVLAWVGRGVAARDARRPVPLTAVKGQLLAMGGLGDARDLPSGLARS